MSNVAEFQINLKQDFLQTFKKMQSSVEGITGRLKTMDGKFIDTNKSVKKVSDSIGGDLNKNINVGSIGVSNFARNVGALALQFVAVSKAISFVGDSLKEATSQYQSIQKYADEMARFKTNINLSNNEFQDLANNLSKNTNFKISEIMEVAVKSVRFKGMTKEKMTKSIKLAMGIKEREGVSLEQGIDVVSKVSSGKPTEQLEAMRNAGVPVTKEMQRLMTVLEETGQYAQATAVNMQFLSRNYEDFAEISAKRNPLFLFNKSMDTLQSSIGKFAYTMKASLGNAFDYISKKVQGLVTFIEANKVAIFSWGKAVAKVVGVLLGIWALYRTALFLNKAGIIALALVTKGWQIAQMLVNGQLIITNAQLLATNVLSGGLLIAIGSIIVGLVALVKHWEKVGIYVKYWVGYSLEIIRKFGSDVWEIMKAIGNVIKGVFTADFEGIATAFDGVIDRMEKRALQSKAKLKGLTSEFDKSISSLNERERKEKEKEDAKFNFGSDIVGSKIVGSKIDSATGGVGQSAMSNVQATSPKVFILNIQELNGLNMKNGKIVGKDVESEIKGQLPEIMTQLTNAIAEIQTSNL